MFLAIANLIDPTMLAALQDEVAGLAFEDGAKTARRFAAQVKANDQAAPSPVRDAVLATVTRAMQAHPLFAGAARPPR
jgi:PKHD-type hydroxylase